MKRKNLILLGATALATSTFGLTAAYAEEAAPGAAQSAPQSDAQELQEIIVTAQKRSERVLDVPISIAAVTGDQLVERGITNTEELTQVVPGFTYQKSTYGTPVFQIRGVGFYDTSVGASPTVSVYVDQVPLPYSSMARGVALDLERVEVLKGPQGTLFGQNSTGGAINFIAAKPTSTPSMGVDVDYGRFNETNVQAFLSGPLSDTLRIRLVGRYEYGDPWQMGYAPNDQKFGKDPNDQLGARRFATGRLLLDWTPDDRTSFELSVNGWQDRSDAQAAQFKLFAPDNPPNSFNTAVYNAYLGTHPVQALPDNPRLAGWSAGNDLAHHDYLYQISLNGQLQFSEGARLTSISAYSRYHQQSTTDINGVAFPDFITDTTADITSFSQELRLAGYTDRFQWLLGGNYARDVPDETELNNLQSTQANIGPYHFDAVEVRDYQRVETYAGFGSLDFHLTDQLTLQSSVRYTKQDRLFRGCFADPGDGQFAAAFGAAFGAATSAGHCVTLAALPPAPPVVLPTVVGTLNEDNVSWREGVSWKPDRDALLYANVTKGYKAGGFPAVPGGFAFQYSPATQESVLAYEAGYKKNWLGGKITVTGAGFYYDYTNKQLLGVVPVYPLGYFPRLINIPKSRVVGGELNVTVVPVRGLTLSAGGTYVDSRVLKDPASPINAYGVLTTYVGSSFPNTPLWQGVGDAEYRFPVGGQTEAFFGASVTARTWANAVFNGETPAAPGQPPLKMNGYALLDLRLGIEKGQWRAMLWGRNVTNTYYLLNEYRLSDAVAGLTGMPATYGISLSYRY